MISMILLQITFFVKNVSHLLRYALAWNFRLQTSLHILTARRDKDYTVRCTEWPWHTQLKNEQLTSPPLPLSLVKSPPWHYKRLKISIHTMSMIQNISDIKLSNNNGTPLHNIFHPLTINLGITLWNELPLKCNIFPLLPTPFSPVQRHLGKHQK